MEGLLAFRMIPLYIGESGRVERSTGLLVSDNYFTGLGLTPALGRFLRADEVEKPGTAPVVVISYDYWQTRFGGSPAALGQVIRVNGVDLTIVGVTPQGFKGTVMRLVFDFWLPATLAPAVLNGTRELDDRGFRGYTVTGTLARGATRRAGAGGRRRRRCASSRWRSPRPTARCRASSCRTGNRRAGRSG